MADAFEPLVALERPRPPTSLGERHCFQVPVRTEAFPVVGHRYLRHLAEIRRSHLELIVLILLEVAQRVRAQPQRPGLAVIAKQRDADVGIRACSLLVARANAHVVQHLLLRRSSGGVGRRQLGAAAVLLALDRGSQGALRQQDCPLRLHERVAVVARLREHRPEHQVGLRLALRIGRRWPTWALHLDGSLELQQRVAVLARLAVAVALLRRDLHLQIGRATSQALGLIHQRVSLLDLPSRDVFARQPQRKRHSGRGAALQRLAAGAVGLEAQLQRVDHRVQRLAEVAVRRQRRSLGIQLLDLGQLL